MINTVALDFAGCIGRAIIVEGERRIKRGVKQEAVVLRPQQLVCETRVPPYCKFNRGFLRLPLGT